MRWQQKLCLATVVLSTVFFGATNGFAYDSFGTTLNRVCAANDARPYTGSCNLCHASSKGTWTDAMTAYDAGGDKRLDYFCPAPAPPPCTDSDGDSYAAEGGSCGPVDCNDRNAAINPGATENCTDNRDNDCDGFVDGMDLDAVGCPPPCTDSDGDTYAAEGGACGPVDCDDNDPGINPGAVDIANNGIDEDCNDRDFVDVSILDNDGDGFTPAAGDCDDTDGAVHPDTVEICTDGMDNDCDGMVDTLDPDAIDCPVACTDADGDYYAVGDGKCGPIDCDDRNGAVNPGEPELCDDLIDNDCDGVIDEGCDRTCPDNDGDGYPDASCGGTDCDDSDTAVNPAAAEVCGNNIDENCNGASDDVCTTCPDGAQLQVRTAEYDYKKRSLKISGRANSNTTVTLLDTDTGSILAANLKVKRGRFYKKMRGLDPDEVPVRVAAINKEGCASAELQIRMENMSVENEDDRGYGDHEREHERDNDHDDDDDHDRDHERDDDDD